MLSKIAGFCLIMGLIMILFNSTVSVLFFAVSWICAFIRVVWCNSLRIPAKIMWTLAIHGLFIMIFNHSIGVKMLFFAALILIGYIFKYIFIK